MSDGIGRAIDRVIRFSLRHKRPIEIAGAIWFALGCAVYARFLALPAIPFLTDQMALYMSAATNALWYGFVRPYGERRTKRLIAGGELPHAKS